MRGILEHDYGVPHKSIEWLSELDEDVDFSPPPGLHITQVSQDKSLEDMLVDGEIDALLSPDLIRPLTAGDKRVGRLFPNYKEEEIAFYRKTGIFPIMHVVGIKQEIVERHPWVATNLYKAFEQSKALAMERMENPRIVPLAWYREGWEEQERILGKDPWEYGLTERNAKNFERLVTYSHEQGLIKRRFRSMSCSSTSPRAASATNSGFSASPLGSAVGWNAGHELRRTAASPIFRS